MIFVRRNTYILLALAFIGWVALFSFCACRKATIPRPYGYFRITTPPHEYHPSQIGGAVCDISDYATLIPKSEEGFYDIHYPTLNADIHISYKPVRHNLRELSDDAMEFVYKHVQQVSSIPEQTFMNDDARVYGVLFHLEGNAASPFQFFLTDSTRHFLRGAAYCYCRPNADSLAPVHTFLNAELRHLIETLHWKQ